MKLTNYDTLDSRTIPPSDHHVKQKGIYIHLNLVFHPCPHPIFILYPRRYFFLRMVVLAAALILIVSGVISHLAVVSFMRDFRINV